MDIAWKERSEHTSVDGQKYAYNKQLMFGSLLLFTSDGFESVVCATVLDSSVNLLRDGYVSTYSSYLVCMYHVLLPKKRQISSIIFI